MARRALGPATLTAVQALQRSSTERSSTERSGTDADTGLLVACSGGPDSLALAVAAAEFARRRELPVGAVVVDHGLQPGSAAVAVRALADLDGLGLRAETVRVEVRPDGSGPEAAARAARRQLLERLAEERAVTIVLGHTRDDQAETVLLGLARGSGARSLAGMAVRRGRFWRPFLDLPRAVTTAVCAEAGLTPWSDPHNADPAFARARVRHRVLPALEAELGPGVAEALARTARLLREDADLLDRLAAQHPPDPEPDCSRLAGLPAALRRRVLRDWLREAGAADLGAGHLEAVDRLVTDWHGQRFVEVPGLAVSRSDGRLVAVPVRDRPAGRGAARLWQADPRG